jgi:hypothetical protein
MLEIYRKDDRVTILEDTKGGFIFYHITGEEDVVDEYEALFLKRYPINGYGTKRSWQHPERVNPDGTRTVTISRLSTSGS